MQQDLAIVKIQVEHIEVHVLHTLIFSPVTVSSSASFPMVKLLTRTFEPVVTVTLKSSPFSSISEILLMSLPFWMSSSGRPKMFKKWGQCCVSHKAILNVVQTYLQLKINKEQKLLVKKKKVLPMAFIKGSKFSWDSSWYFPEKDMMRGSEGRERRARSACFILSNSTWQSLTTGVHDQGSSGPLLSDLTPERRLGKFFRLC